MSAYPEIIYHLPMLNVYTAVRLCQKREQMQSVHTVVAYLALRTRADQGVVRNHVWMASVQLHSCHEMQCQIPLRTLLARAGGRVVRYHLGPIQTTKERADLLVNLSGSETNNLAQLDAAKMMIRRGAQKAKTCNTVVTFQSFQHIDNPQNSKTKVRPSRAESHLAACRSPPSPPTG